MPTGLPAQSVHLWAGAGAGAGVSGTARLPGEVMYFSYRDKKHKARPGPGCRRC